MNKNPEKVEPSKYSRSESDESRSTRALSQEKQDLTSSNLTPNLSDKTAQNTVDALLCDQPQLFAKTDFGRRYNYFTNQRRQKLLNGFVFFCLAMINTSRRLVSSILILDSSYAVCHKPCANSLIQQE